MVLQHRKLFLKLANPINVRADILRVQLSKSKKLKYRQLCKIVFGIQY